MVGHRVNVRVRVSVRVRFKFRVRVSSRAKLNFMAWVSHTFRSNFRNMVRVYG